MVRPRSLRLSGYAMRPWRKFWRPSTGQSRAAPSTELTDAQRAAVELLRASQRVILTGHERPDGDCVGAQAALARVLQALGKEVFILNSDPVATQRDALITGHPQIRHQVANL